MTDTDNKNTPRKTDLKVVPLKAETPKSVKFNIKDKIRKSWTSVSDTTRSSLNETKSFFIELHEGARSIPLFTTIPAFKVMRYGLRVIALITIPAIIGLLLTKQPELVMGVTGLGGVLFTLGFILALLFALICAGYLSLTDNWDIYRTWRALLKLEKLDKKRPYTTNSSLVIDRLGCPQDRGLFFGMAEATRYPKREVSKLTYDDDRHAVMIAGSRAGKGTSYIVPNMIHHQGSVIINDPSGETFHLTAAYRQHVLKQRVILLDPMNVTGVASQQWNPMGEIDFDNDPFVIDKCYMLAESILAQQSHDPYWTEAGRKMLALVIAYVGNRAIPELNHLGTVRDMLLGGDASPLWMAMTECEAYGGIIRRYGEANLVRETKELGSVLETVRTGLKFLDSDVMTEFVTQSSFALRDLKQGDVTVYIVLPAGSGEAFTPWTRLLFNAAFHAAQDLTIPKPAHPTLFIMDEFALLGRMERIKQAAGEAAKFGVKLFIVVQDISQLEEHYDVAWETFIANSGILIMFSNNDVGTQQYLSMRLGKHEVKKLSFSSGSGGSTTTSWATEEVGRSDQVEKWASRQSGYAFVFVTGRKPFRLKRATYYDWDMIPEGLSYDPDYGSAKTPKAKRIRKSAPQAAE